MIKPFQYQVQVNASTNMQQRRDAQIIFDHWLRLDTDKNEKARYDVTQNNEDINILKMVSGTFDQRRLSGRYSENHLNLTNYKFAIEMIPSYEPGYTPGIFGSLFWYLDDNHFYYVGWDGGRYGWGDKALRIYKYLNGSYILVKAFDVPYYTANNTYEFDMELINKTMTLTVYDITNGTESVYTATDSKGWGKGAYGPAGAGQPITFLSIVDFAYSEVKIQKMFENELNETHRDLSSDKQLTTNGVHSHMLSAIEEWKLTHEHNGFEILSYQVGSLTDGVFVYFGDDSNQKLTYNGLTEINAFMDIDMFYVPETPLNFQGTPQSPNEIKWTWESIDPKIEGFIITDAFDNTLAIVGKSARAWTETGLNESTTYARYIKSYYQTKNSDKVMAEATTPELPPPPPPKPEPPISVDGEAKDPYSIEWNWAVLEKTCSDYVFKVYDEYGRLKATVDGECRWLETGLNPETLYNRYIIAIDKETGLESDPSMIASETTPKVSMPELPTEPTDPVVDNPGEPVYVPPAPIDFAGVGIDNHTIEWSWDVDENSNHTCFKIYDALTNTLLVHIKDPEARNWMEEGLDRSTTYYRYIVTCTPEADSDKSDVAEAKTLSNVEPGDNVTEEPWWDPNDIVCVKQKREDDTYIEAFHSGIGDHLDLNTKTDTESTPKEQFTYEVQATGKIKEKQIVYPKREFDFRFFAKGELEKLTSRGDYTMKVKAYLARFYDIEGKAEVDAPEKGRYSYQLVGIGKRNRQIPHWFSYRIGRDLIVNRTYTWDAFNWITSGMDIRGNWNALTDTAIRNLDDTKTSWSLYPQSAEFSDYEFTSNIRVDSTNPTDRDIAIAIRSKKNSKGEYTGYGLVIGKNEIKWVKFKSGFNHYDILDSEPIGYEYGKNYEVHVKAVESEFVLKVVNTTDGITVYDKTLFDFNDPYITGAVGFVSYKQKGVNFTNYEVNEIHQDAIYTGSLSTSITNENLTGWSSEKQIYDNSWIDELSVKQNNLLNDYVSKHPDSFITISVRDEKPIWNDGNISINFDSVYNVMAKTDAKTLEIREETITSQTDWEHVEVLQQPTDILHKTNSEVESLIESYRVAIETEKDFDTFEWTAINLQTEGNNVTIREDSAGVWVNASIDTHYQGIARWNGDVYGYEGNKVIGRLEDFKFINSTGKELSSSKLPEFTPEFINHSDVPYILSGKEITVFVEEFVETEITGVVNSGRKIYKTIVEMFPDIDASNYHFEVEKTNDASNVWFQWRTSKSRHYNGKVLTKDASDILVIGAEYRVEKEPFNMNTVWYKGYINGTKPYELNNMGKENLRAPLEIELPDGAKNVEYGVQISDDSPADVTVVFENVSGTPSKVATTTHYFDVALFESHYLKEETIEKKWKGTLYNPGIVREIEKDQSIKLRTECYAPLKEIESRWIEEATTPVTPTTPVATTPIPPNVTDFKVSIRSHNPNVYIWLDEEEQARIPWTLRNETFLPVTAHAKLINHTQTPWHPLIHNGYYYFHEKEHYLYAESKVEEMYAEKEIHSLTFKYMLEIMTRYKEDDYKKYINHNRPSLYSGIYFNVENRAGSLSVEFDGTIHQDFGYYVSQELTPGIDYDSQTWSNVKSIDKVTWEEEGIGWGDPAIQISSVNVYLQSREENGQWGEWEKVNNGEEISDVDGNTIRYRVELNAGKTRSVEYQLFSDKEQSDFLKGVIGSNITFNDNGNLTMATESIAMDENKFTSQVFDIGEKADSVEEIKAKVHLPGDKKQPKIGIYTATRPTPFTSDWADHNVTWIKADANSMVDLGDDWYEITFNVSNDNPDRYFKYQLRFLEVGEEYYSTVYLDNDIDEWRQGDYKETDIDYTLTNDMIIKAPSDIAEYISRPLYVGKREDRGTFELNIKRTFDGKGVRLFTNVGATSTELRNNISSNIGWSEVSLSSIGTDLEQGQSVSSPQPWIAYKLQFERGLSESYWKVINIDERSDFETGEFINVKYDGIMKQLMLQDSSEKGEYISPAYEFNHVQSWGEFLPTFNLNGGDLEWVIETSHDKSNWVTADSQIIDVNSATPTPNIPNDLRKYLRYKIRFNPIEEQVTDELSGSNLKIIQGERSHIELDGNIIKNSNNLINGVYTSPVYDLSGIVSFNHMNFTKMLEERGDVKVYTRTSYDKRLQDWEDWQLVTSTGNIQSKPKRFFQFQAHVKPGVKEADFEKEWKVVQRDEFKDNWLSGNPLDATSLMQLEIDSESAFIPVNSVSNESDWYYYDTDIYDLESEVHTFEHLAMRFSQLPFERQTDDIKVLIATAEQKEDINGEGHGRWQEATPQSLTNHYNIPFSGTDLYARFIRVRIGLRVGKSKKESISKVITPNGTHENTVDVSGVIKLDTNQTKGTFTSNTIDLHDMNESDLAKFHELKLLSYHTEDATIGGDMTIEYQTFDSTPGTIWEHDLSLVDRTKRYLRYRVSIGAGRTSSNETTKTLLSGVSSSTESPWTDIGGLLEDLVEVTTVQTGTASYQMKFMHEDGTESDWINVVGNDVEYNNTVFSPIIKVKVKADISSGSVDDVSIRYTRYYRESPTISDFMIHSVWQRYKSPVLESIKLESPMNGRKDYVISSVKDLSISYLNRTFKAPIVNEVQFSGYVRDDVSPILSYINLTVQSYNSVLPSYERTEIKVADYVFTTRTPMVRNVKIESTIEGKEEEQMYYKEYESSIPHDMDWHRVTDFPISMIALDQMNEQDLHDGEYLVNFRAYPFISGVDFAIMDENMMINEDGYIFAKTNPLAEEKVFRQNRIHIKQGKYAFITAIPHQGSPVIVMDEKGPMNRVSFFDNKGNPTLDFTETLYSEERRDVALSFTDIDIESMKIEVDETGKGDWKKIDKFTICENLLYLPEIYRAETPIRVSYRIMRSFVVDHNFKPHDNVARLEFHRPILRQDQSVKVYAETNFESAYYQANEVNLNPLQQFNNHGFMYLTKSVRPATKIEVFLSKDTLYANGREHTNVIIRALDIDGNPVVDEEILLSIKGLPTNTLEKVHGFTNSNGVFATTMKPPYLSQEKTFHLTVYAKTSNIRDSKPIPMRPELSKPILSVWSDETVVTSISGDTAIYAKLVDNRQQPISNAPIYFESSDGTLSSIVGRTNYLGVTKVELKPPSDNETKKIEINVQSVDYNIQTAMRLKYKP